MPHLKRRDWTPNFSENVIQAIATGVDARSVDDNLAELHRLVACNSQIHERDCINLNPAGNVMNPVAEAMLSACLGSRPSLGYPGNKYEMGLEALEEIEVFASELAAEVFHADYVELRVPSGALANLYVFMAVAQPGDAIVAPSPAIGGHVSHLSEGAAGCYGLKVHHAPVDKDRYTIQVDELREQVLRIRPRIISIGGSLNLFPHPVREIRAIADEVGACVLYDAAHVAGLIAGGQWQNPLEEGAHVVTMSTYKSLAGPPSGLILTNDADVASGLDRVAFPGLTANFDMGKIAALAATLLDWKSFGNAYAYAMKETASALVQALASEGVPVFNIENGGTQSHQIALSVAEEDGQGAARRLREANFLTSGIGLPRQTIGADSNGLRLGTSEIVRWGMGAASMPDLARLFAQALLHRRPCQDIASDVSKLRRQFTEIHFVNR
jgi:glycine hydroxymethyltransferase